MKKHPCREGCEIDREWKVSRHGKFSWFWDKRASPSVAICRVESQKSQKLATEWAICTSRRCAEDRQSKWVPYEEIFFALTGLNLRNKSFIWGWFPWFSTALFLCGHYFCISKRIVSSDNLSKFVSLDCFSRRVYLPSGELVPNELFAQTTCRLNAGSLLHMNDNPRKMSPYQGKKFHFINFFRQLVALLKDSCSTWLLSSDTHFLHLDSTWLIISGKRSKQETASNDWWSIASRSLCQVFFCVSFLGYQRGHFKIWFEALVWFELKYWSWSGLRIFQTRCLFWRKGIPLD